MIAARPRRAREPAMPLLAETLILIAAAYTIGVGLGWLLFGRKKKTSFLGDRE